MRTRSLPSLLLGLFFAFAGVGAAAASQRIVLRLDDVAAIRGSHLICAHTTSTVHLKGKRVIGCVKLAKGRPVPRSYAAVLAFDGTLAVVRYSADARSSKLVFKRTLARRTAHQATVPASIGDVLHAAGTSYGCTIAAAPSGGPIVSCVKLAGMRAAPNTFGFSISDRGVLGIRFDGNGRPSVLYTRTHGA